jgi:hypothetical protein
VIGATPSAVEEAGNLLRRFSTLLADPPIASREALAGQSAEHNLFNVIMRLSRLIDRSAPVGHRRAE